MKKFVLGLVALVIVTFSGELEDGEKAYQNSDFKKAFQSFIKVCNSKNLSGCNWLGVLYAKGQGTKQNYFKAKEYYQKACDGGNVFGCNNLGNLYRDSQGVKQNKTKAKELFGKACDMGNQYGCDQYAKLNSQGY
ncbi:Sel1 domain repeat-containing protein [Campylobacter iguaniorum]|uniref:beta-lactamase n=2 Tax=Campylobacter iguaniorum TaxID=1244531 RepID=A0A076FEC1_9BACT|nr:tetratricopeptide repeat protein [Campylobacter iguaniorum]AII14194.1 Sel1 domain repeat-containing protein [Campylobacter iguaniorum]ALV23936.1 Sel1 domain repeat-containing protein [Campylobacter iguaniorum]